MSAWLEELERRERESQLEISRHARLLRLAEMNGYPASLSQPDGLEGTWWEVPGPMITIVGCMLARVA